MSGVGRLVYDNIAKIGFEHGQIINVYVHHGFEGYL